MLCQGLPQQSWPSAVPCVCASASRKELETGQRGKSRDAPCLPYCGAAGAHQFSFLHQTAIMGGQPCIRSTKGEAQPLRCQ